MKNNLIPFPVPRQVDNDKDVLFAPSGELKALREAFDRARAEWVMEIAELPENNKIYSGSKK